MMQLARACALCVVAIASGCAGDANQPAQPNAAAAAEANDPDLQDALGQAMRAAAREQAPGWEKLQKLWRGELASHERQDFMAVLVYGHCYRFVGVGAPGVEDLDLALFDPHGVEVQRDVTQQSTAVLGAEVAICPVQPGAYRVGVRMRQGAGGFAVGLYRDRQ